MFNHSVASTDLPASVLARTAAAPGLLSAPQPGRFRRLTEYFFFENCLTNPNEGRRARLVAWFGLLGFAFGNFYAAFYFVIGHFWGVGIITVCSLLFLAAPFLMKHFRSVSLGANFLAAIMTLGFTGLCCVEGGLKGHAVAWLASVPLCALLLAGRRAAGIWVIISFAAAAGIVAADIAEIPIPIKYDPAWSPLVDSTGYLGLIAFMFGLGLIFEKSREQAFDRMTHALQDLAQSNEKLSALNQEKTEFLGIAAHDLRNPLTVIISFAEILRESGPAEDVSKFAEMIYDAGARMRDLISNLLDANAIEEGRISQTMERCEVAQLLAQSVAQNQLNASRKGSEIVTSTEPQLCARTDRSTAIQILDNLISNALKYAPPQTVVFVTAERDDHDVVISVKDQGPGISEEDQRKLFGKFTRLSARPTGGESSTGLGLSIVKRLVTAMHGTIECRTALGEGSTFIARLPIWLAESAPIDLEAKLK